MLRKPERKEGTRNFNLRWLVRGISTSVGGEAWRGFNLLVEGMSTSGNV
jgi:hypothetical protein